MDGGSFIDDKGPMTTRRALAMVTAACTPGFDVRLDVMQDIEKQIGILEARLNALRFQTAGAIMAAPVSPGNAIIQQVANKHRVTVIQIMSKRRTKYIVLARHEAIWRISTELAWSSPQIAAVFDMDHSSVLHAIRTHEERRGEAVGAD